MAKADARKNTRVYHLIVAILILLSGAGLLGVGIWLRYSDHSDILDLQYNDNTILSTVLKADVAAMIIGGFLILSGIVSLIALSKNCVGITFRIIYVIMALIIFVALLGITVFSILFLTRRNDSDVRKVVSDAWESTVSNNDTSKVVCAIEKTFTCRGFDDNDCTNCVIGLEPTCNSSRCAVCGPTNPDADSSVGCYNIITDKLRSIFLPSGIVAGILAVVVLLDIFFSCCL